MKKISAIWLVLASLLGGDFAFAQPVGPGPQPQPWIVAGPTISYNYGGITLPVNVTGGTKGIGTINAQGYYLNGAALTSGGSFAATSPLSVTFPSGVVTYACTTCAVTTNPLSQFAATTSAQLLGVLSDETGSGLAVFNNAPTLIAPVLGAATATSINKLTITAPATSATLTIANGKTLTASNSLTFTGTDATSFAFPATSGAVLTADSTATVTNKTYDTAATGNSFSINGLAATANTGTGSVVRSTAPSLSTPNIGAATATSIAITGTASVLGPSLFQSASTMTFAGGTSGYNWDNQSIGAVLMSLSNTGALALPLGTFTIGTAGSVAGNVILAGATSGTATLAPPVSGGGTVSLFAGTDTVVGLAVSQILTNKTFNCANNTCTVRLGSDVTGVLPAANGGTGVNNGANTITVGGNFSASSTVAITGAFSTAGAVTHAGAFATTLTATATTNSTLPAGTHTLAGLDVAQTWSATQTFNSNTLRAAGTTSGTLALNAAAISATSSITFPAGTTDFSSTGGTGQFVKQSSTGAPFTVATILAADLPVATTGAFGAVKPDGTTITISGGVITASGASATAVTVGTTNVVSGTTGFLLYNNAGTLGNQSIASALGVRTTLPTVQRFLSGSSTYNTPANVLWIEVEMIGAGGGGSGSGTTNPNGTTGGNTTFGAMTAGGGTFANGQTSGGPGNVSGLIGTVTQSSPGNLGGAGVFNGNGAVHGGSGGISFLGGGAPGGALSSLGNPAPANSGGGGSGAGAQFGQPTSQAGAGGGSGGYIKTIINTPSSTYAYGVGTGGTGGAAGSLGFVGGAGANGIIVVTEHYGT